MEWSSDIMLQLIDAYRDRPVLWDAHHRFYRLSHRKNEAWTELAAIFNSDVLQVKRKINSLLASFRRERHKVRLGEYGQVGGRKEYRSSWFAFDRFSFLYDRDKWKAEQIQNVQYIEQTDEQENFIQQKETTNNQDVIKIETNNLNEENSEEEISATEELEEETCQVARAKKPIPPQRKARFKNKPTSDDTTLIRALKVLQKSSTKHRDECDVYAEYISSKLRKFDDRTRSIVQHVINNVLFDADMGKYNNTQFVYNSDTGFSTSDAQVCSTQFQQNTFPSSSNQQMV